MYIIIGELRIDTLVMFARSTMLVSSLKLEKGLNYLPNAHFPCHLEVLCYRGAVAMLRVASQLGELAAKSTNFYSPIRETLSTIVSVNPDRG